VELVAIVDLEGNQWVSPPLPVGKRVVIDVDEDTLLEEAVVRAVKATGTVRPFEDVDPRYYWVHYLRDADNPDAGYLGTPSAVVAKDGEILWMEGAKDRVTIGDVVRAKQVGLFDGDPLGVWLEKPLGGDGIPPDWTDFFNWLGAIGGAVGLFDLLKSLYTRWQERGARSPYAFLDVVLSREEWNRRDLSQLLGLSAKEATDLLDSFGYDASDIDPEFFRLSPDPERSAIRRKILEDQLHRASEESEEEFDDLEDD
jgi:hypothetical protein